MGYSGSMSFGRSGGREEGRATVSSQLNAVVHFEPWSAEVVAVHHSKIKLPTRETQLPSIATEMPRQ